LENMSYKQNKLKYKNLGYPMFDCRLLEITFFSPAKRILWVFFNIMAPSSGNLQQSP